MQLSFYLDARGREPRRLLERWPALTGVAAATEGRGIATTVVQPAEVDAQVSWTGVDVHFVRERSPPALLKGRGHWMRPLPWRLVDHVAALEPDLVHVHSLSFPLHVRLLAQRMPGIPLLVQDHADGVLPGVRRRLQRFGLAPVDGVAFTAREQARPFRDADVLRPEHAIFEVVEVSTEFGPGDRRAARRQTGLHGDPCLLWVGHLDPNKDPLTVLDAFRRARPSLPDPRLWFCYRAAPLLDRVRERVAEDEVLRERVRLLGPRPHPEIEGMLRAADFLVQGSHREGSGFAVIEALACGTPPLVTDIPAFRRLTDDGRVGSLTPPGDPAAMAEAIVAWSSRDRGEARRAARRHFERELSYEAIGRDLARAYRELLSGGGGEQRRSTGIPRARGTR